MKITAVRVEALQGFGASARAAPLLKASGYTTLNTRSIEVVRLADETVRRAAIREGVVTREEKERAVDAALARYEHLGATIAADDQALVRLLQTLELSSTDRDVGEYLCSFLVA